MVRNKIFLLFVLLMPLSLHGQKSFTLDDVVPGGKNFYKYYPRYVGGSFTLENDDFIEAANDSFFVWNKTLQRHFIADTKQMRALLDSELSQNQGRIVPFAWLDSYKLWVIHSGNYYLLDLKQNAVLSSISMEKNGANADFNVKGGAVAYTIGNNLYVSKTGSEPKQITTDGDDDHVYGQTVHRDEFGIHKGTFWAPNASKLAFYFMDQSMVDDYPLVDVSTRIATLTPVKYPMAGLKSHHVKVGVYDMTSEKTIYLNTGEPADRFFTNIAWTPDGSGILVAEVNRGQNHMNLNLYDAVTGNLVRTLFQESDSKWIEPSHPAVFLKNSPDRFVWESKRNGYNHLYLYDLSGNLIRQLTQGEWNVTSFYGFDETEKNLFVQSTIGGYLERHVLSVAVASGKVKRLTVEAGTHSALFSKSRSVWIDYFSSLKVPARTTISVTATGRNRLMREAENPYKDFNMPEIKMVDLKTADGQYPLTGRMVLPVNFDPQKKYPVIVYVYGGPHSQMVSNRWLGGASTWKLWAAQKGYIVFTMDNRGTDGHGKEFEQAIHRQLGKCEMDDQMQGVAYLKSLPFVDADRIGVNGWSYGGFMTTSLMLNHNDVFKVGVAGGPVIDWKLYEIMYGERYMDMPQENPEGYAANNLCGQVKNLKGRLMLIHGDVDPVVVWQHSLLFVREAVKNRVQLDYFVYPGHPHNVIGPDRVHLIEKMMRYYDDFL